MISAKLRYLRILILVGFACTPLPTVVASHLIFLHAHRRHFRSGHDGAGVLQRCVGGLECGNGGVVNFRHRGNLLVPHVGNGMCGHGNLGLLLARLLVRGGVKGQEKEQVR